MPLDRRHFIAGAASAPVAAPAAAAPAAAARRIVADGAVFAWRHAEGRIACEFDAPAPGWVAVGFNAARQLRGTRFVIAATSPVRIEERIARVPAHVPAAHAALVSATVARQHGRTRLAFAWPHEIPGGPLLAPGTSAHAMLAWWHDDDFQHHSAWRRHFDVVL